MLKVISIIVFSMLTHRLMAFDIFDFQGPRAKLYGGAGITESRSGASILYNPANIFQTADHSYYFDLSPSRIQYQFTPPDPEVGAGTIEVPVAPLLSVGSSVSNKQSGIGIGFVIIPTGANTKTEVERFPVAVNGQYQEASIVNQRTAYKLGTGLAFRITDELDFGFSFLYDYQKNSSQISVDGEEFLKLNDQNTFLIPKLGLRYEWQGVMDLGLEFQPKMTSWYSLDAAAFGGEPTQAYRQKYRPQVVGIGASTTMFSQFQVFGQYRHEKWVDGTFVDESPTQTILGSAPVEFINSHSFVLGSAMALGTGYKATASYSFFGPNKGAGVSSPDGETMAYGRGLQDFESLKRYHLTGGLEMTSASTTSTAYASYAKATAVSEEGTPSAGFYDLTVYMLGYGRFFN
jgi:opacity protein-like surface antigen